MFKKALVIIDVQNDFCAGGPLSVIQEESVILTINGLISRYHHVILAQDWHPPNHASFASSHEKKAPYTTIMTSYGEQTLWPDHCIMGTRGAAFHPQLNTVTAGLILRKGCNPAVDSYSAFFENDRQTQTGLAGYLNEHGVKHLTFCGLATDFCVAYSALDAVRQGFRTRVVLDACRALDLDGSLDKALKTMQESGIELTLSA